MKKLVMILFAVFVAFTAISRDPVTPANMSATAKAQYIAKLEIPTISSGFQLLDTVPRKTEVDGKVQSLLINGLQAMGSDVKLWPVGAHTVLGATYTMINSRELTVTFNVRERTSITGVHFKLSTIGDYTANNYNGFVLYSLNVSTGALTRVTDTANDDNIWKTNTTLPTKAFQAAQTLNPGVYVLAAVWNSSASTTAPILYMHNAYTTQNILFSNSIKVTGYKAAVTTSEASAAMSDFTALAYVGGFWLY